MTNRTYQCHRCHKTKNDETEPYVVLGDAGGSFPYCGVCAAKVKIERLGRPNIHTMVIHHEDGSSTIRGYHPDAYSDDELETCKLCGNVFDDSDDTEICDDCLEDQEHSGDLLTICDACGHEWYSDDEDADSAISGPCPECGDTAGCGNDEHAELHVEITKNLKGRFDFVTCSVCRQEVFASADTLLDENDESEEIDNDLLGDNDE